MPSASIAFSFLHSHKSSIPFYTFSMGLAYKNETKMAGQRTSLCIALYHFEHPTQQFQWTFTIKKKKKQRNLRSILNIFRPFLDDSSEIYFIKMRPRDSSILIAPLTIGYPNKFLQSLKFMVVHRGPGSHIYCDNATNFVESSKKLLEFKDFMFNLRKLCILASQNLTKKTHYPWVKS